MKPLAKAVLAEKKHEVIHFRAPESLRLQLQADARKHGSTLSQYVLSLVEQWTDGQGLHGVGTYTFCIRRLAQAKRTITRTMRDLRKRREIA